MDLEDSCASAKMTPKWEELGYTPQKEIGNDQVLERAVSLLAV
jgi:hypothetical protein